MKTITILIALMLTLSACTSSRLPKAEPSPDSSGDEKPIAGDTHFITSVDIVASSTTGTSSGGVKIYFDPSRSTGPINGSCQTGSSGSDSLKPCTCKLSWKEINQTTGVSIPISRSIQLAVASVEPYGVTCAAPQASVYNNEILDDTHISIAIFPTGGNNTAFSTNTFDYIKKSANKAGTFKDQQGHFFDNIHRYTCYEQFRRGMSVESKPMEVTTPAGKLYRIPMASQFCVKKANGQASGSSQGCEGKGEIENSAQAYYYNLYTRRSEAGSINSGNTRFICPKVDKPLAASGNPTNAWPMDTSFALSLDHTTDFNVGIEAYIRVSNGEGDPGSGGSRCFATNAGTSPSPSPSASGGGDSGGSSGTSDTTSLVLACLGFATKPAQDGTCPSFIDEAGKKRQTYRLRRFIALYPPVFDTNGSYDIKTIKQSQASDTIYVLDRPVKPPANESPDRSYTMRGPKPCPFAFFDRKGVTGVLKNGSYTKTNGNVPYYVATNNDAWTGTNVDGIEFPNSDSATSCAAVLPIPNSTRKLVGLGTVSPYNPKYPHVYVRPIEAWAPHYVEDTDLQACAPQSGGDNGIIDPPLHFAKDQTTGNIAWCSEVYPTQNSNIESLDVRPANNVTDPYYGLVKPFTSHTVKNSVSAQCIAKVPSTVTALGTKYPNPDAATTCSTDENALPAHNYVAHHPASLILDKYIVATAADNDPGVKVNACANTTCDRTVTTMVQATWPRFPLLASAEWTERAITSDTTYGCVFTWDNGNGKTGNFSPSDGCCGANVKMLTGFASLSGYKNNSTAHLEPDAKCLTPKY